MLLEANGGPRRQRLAVASVFDFILPRAKFARERRYRRKFSHRAFSIIKVLSNWAARETDTNSNFVNDFSFISLSICVLTSIDWAHFGQCIKSLWILYMRFMNATVLKYLFVYLQVQRRTQWTVSLAHENHMLLYIWDLLCIGVNINVNNKITTLRTIFLVTNNNMWLFVKNFERKFLLFFSSKIIILAYHMGTYTHKTLEIRVPLFDKSIIMQCSLSSHEWDSNMGREESNYLLIKVWLGTINP